MKNSSVHHVHVKRDDGSIVLFPVSRHVVSLKPSTSQSTQEAVSQKRYFFPWRRKVNVASLALLFATVSISTLNLSAGNTLSYFRDIESSIGNFFGAALLDFVVADSSIARTITATTTPLIIPVMTPESGSLETLYKVTAAYTSGNIALCNALDVVATTSPFIYSGDLLTMSTTATTTEGAWQLGLLLTATSGIAHGDICELDLIYRGWHPSAPEYTGFTDEEKVHLIIMYEALANDFDVVLNEFLPNPDIAVNGMNLGQDSDTDPDPTDNQYIGEWIELYNKGPVAVDVANWYMTDASGGAGNTHAVIGPTNTNTGATIIPPGGWIVVFMNKATLGNANAEEIHLYTDDNVEVDFVAYDNPSDYCENDMTPGTGNISSSTASGVPGNGPSADCPQNQVAPNKSYARFPDGTGPWYDPVPTPGFWNVVLPGDPLLEAPIEETAPAPTASVEEMPVTEDAPEESAPDSSSTPLEDVPQEPAQETPVVENFSPSGGAPTSETQENSSPSEPPVESPLPEAPVENSSPAETAPTENSETPEGHNASEEPALEAPPADTAPESASEAPPVQESAQEPALDVPQPPTEVPLADLAEPPPATDSPAP